MIKENTQNILSQLPPGVELVAAAKQRTADEIKQAIFAGVKIIGENYPQEAKAKFEVIGKEVKWHLIGHLQRNKVKLAVSIFDLIETVDSLDLAKVLDKELKKINKIMPVLVEVNSAAEPQKQGILPEGLENFIAELLNFPNLAVAGLMTMGPWLEDPEEIRPYFRETKQLFEQIKRKYSGKLKLEYLSMGMSSSWPIAIAEGANIIRVGTAIFGERKIK